MAGKGRPPTPTATLERKGTARSDRHANRKSEPKSSGTPKPPSWLTGEALKFWKRNMPHWEEMGILQGADTDQLVQLSIAWANWRKEQRRYDEGRGHIYAVSNAMKLWSNLASKFGMSPVDRVKLATEAKEERDPLMDILMGSRN